MKKKRLPTSRWGRFARMAALGTRATTGKLAGVLGDKKAEAKLAKTAADALGTMRGLALKMGQMASYVDGMVPEEHRDTYEDAMRKLRAAAPTMSAEAARRVVEEELGSPPDALFESWTEEPFAAASIGQVHRAKTKDGGDVAVKVQFEGVETAIESDLGNASLFTSLLGPIGSKFGIKEQMVEVRERFLEELDYAHEAKQRKLFNADPHPGNYLFEPDGVVWFLDFGCTRELSDDNLELVRHLHRSALAGRMQGLHEAVDEMFQLPASSPAVPLAHAYIERCFEPIWREGGFHITREFAASLMDGMRDNAVAMLKGSSKDWRPMPPEWVFFNRLQLGFYSVLARLDVEVDYHSIDGAIVSRVSSADA